MPVVDTLAFETAVRAGAVSILEGYRTSADVKLQVYRARPASVNAPSAFVDRMTDRIEHTASLRQRYVRAEVIVLHGLFDSGEAVDQRDAFVDGFFDYIRDQLFEAAAGTTLDLVNVEDIPVYVPDWLRLEAQRSYYATRLTLEGFAGTA